MVLSPASVLSSRIMMGHLVGWGKRVLAGAAAN